MMCSQTILEARLAEEAESKARMVAAHEFAHELLRFETRLVGFTTSLRRDGSLQLPAGSRLNIYPPGRSRFERASSAPAFRRGEAAVKTLPRPRPLSAFMNCEAASIPRLPPVPHGGAAMLLPLRTIASAARLSPCTTPSPPPPRPRRVPLDPSRRLITQLRSYLLAGHEVDTHLVQEATNRIVQSFRAWDTDGSGSLSRSEFAMAMAVIGFHCTSEELVSLFEQLDADGSGTIAYAELLGALRDATPGTTPSRPAATAKDTDLHASEYMVSTHELATIESARVQWVDGRSMTGQISDLLMGQMREVVDAFQKWDTDGSNSLTHAEFARAMAALGLKSSQKVEQLWKEFDSDGNGSISFDELRMALDPPKLGAARSTDGGLMSISRAYTPGKSVSKETILKGMRVGPTVAMRSASSQMHEAFEEIATDRVVDVFKAWDVDNNGTLSRTEFARAMVRMGVKASRAELFKLFSELDPDGSGQINYRELHWAIKERKPGYMAGSVDCVAKPDGWRPATR